MTEGNVELSADIDGPVDTNVDIHGAEFLVRNYELMGELRERCPVAKSSAWGGHWLLTSYDAVFDACQDPGLFSSHPDRHIPAAGNDTPFIPIDLDPPMLQKYRKILTPHLSPQAAKRQGNDLRAIANDLIDAFAQTGKADLSQDLFTPLPARWVLRLLDFDEAKWPEWMGWIHAIMHDRATSIEKATEAVVSVGGAVAGEIAKRREHPNGVGLLSAIMREQIDGEPLNDAELTSVVLLMLLGGMDTTGGLAGNAMLRIDADPDLRRRLIEDREVLSLATEEFLRHDTPTQGLSRLVTRDVEFHGRQLKKGDRVRLMFASANRDSTKFDCPDDVILDRSPNRHLAFAVGVHRCLGSNFARAMFQVMIRELLDRLPDVHITGEIERFPDGGDVFGVKHLPVSFTPESPIAAGTRAERSASH